MTLLEKLDAALRQMANVDFLEDTDDLYVSPMSYEFSYAHLTVGDLRALRDELARLRAAIQGSLDRLDSIMVSGLTPHAYSRLSAAQDGLWKALEDQP